MGDENVDDKHLFVCSECGHRFTRHENLKRHVNTNHKNPGIECRYCTKKFKRKDLLKRHVSLRHPDHLEEYVVSEKMQNGSKFHLPTFQAPDIPKSYNPRLHKYYSELPFLPPDFLSHYKDLYFDLFHPYFPLMNQEWVEGDYVAASYLRALVAIGCLSTGLPEDGRLGSELWGAGMSIMEVFLTDDDNNYESEWVQTCIPIFQLSGQFAFEFTDQQYVLFKRAMERCILHEARLEDRTRTKETFVRALNTYYVVDKFKEIFNHASSSLNYTQLTSRLPCENGEYELAILNGSISRVLNRLCSGPIKLNECRLTGLTLVCAIYELIQRERELKFTLNDGNAIPFSVMRAMENLSASVNTCPNYNSQHMDLFWTLYHLVRVESLFNFYRDYTYMGLLFTHDPIETLKSELALCRQVHKMLTLHECAERYEAMSPSFLWALDQLSSRVGKKNELPMERLILARIVYLGWLLVLGLETGLTDPGISRNFSIISDKISALLHDYVYMDLSRPLSNTIRAFCEDKLSSPGAWNLGEKLRGHIFPGA
ncbi:hypothetical protein TRICI_005653 [Trichomonascus ciferrii]|uniref:C2H2-type domain-containing protein n=1 Tax=Trichomonascus ciferrii TaxID=44093 RepID=A0A642UQS0_9ASCO|nr:hypothetical protein TRICI_005653 [Trichomonascus ciferrii]